MSGESTLIHDLRALEAEALEAVGAAGGADELEAVRVSYLGRKDGRISAILRRLGELDASERPAVGAEANRVKATLGEALDARGRELEAAEGMAGILDESDLSLPARSRFTGARHPVTIVVDELWEIFRGLGFTRARGPEVETEWYNFEALNTPLDHPAADEQDTIYLSGGHLLRSHTSPVQVRVMERYQPPIRVLAPGMVYRRDTYDATHAPAFAQLEGLVVDEGVTFVDLKATLAEFARRYWGPGTRIRFRPSFFPFTEPSAEVDVKRVYRDAEGREHETDWLEIMGAGMVDPAVLDSAGIDSERYTGFAFGMGPGRIGMLKYGISDIRAYFENDVRFLQQFARR
ncbi:MAG: phenylalanine--tRNA ligase subunit alpha [Gemmatimonadales bacterium]|nr:MAG: phenylalanine--tRNA ligase subunit alpha [Gemmatimonadales bacterium]